MFYAFLKTCLRKNKVFNTITPENMGKKVSMAVSRVIIPRNIYFLFFNFILLLSFYFPLKKLVTLSFTEELYSHILVIPIISGYLIYQKRKVISLHAGYSFIFGSILISIGIILYLIGLNQGGILNHNDHLSLLVFSAIISWIGGFILIYGVQAFQKAAFPILLLLFMVPIPSLIIEEIIFFLQKGSSEATYVLFKLTGVSFYREGFFFYLPGITIEVAKECSGIRSSLSLFITSLLMGHMLLKTGWKRIILTLFIIPITIFKNGLRIVILSLLAVYVDETFLTDSRLHSNGGILFFMMALSLLGIVLWVLRRSEKNPSNELRKLG